MLIIEGFAVVTVIGFGMHRIFVLLHSKSPMELIGGKHEIGLD
jgi:hypothetical protein